MDILGKGSIIVEQRIYIVIDLKSFYASVECVERGLDTMTARLVVADPERTEKTICLSISPAMKRLGIHNRCRVFEIPKSVDYIMAQPRMQLYIDYAAGIYGIYLKYISKEDIHVYSIDECFMDVTNYLPLYHMTARGQGQPVRGRGNPARGQRQPYPAVPCRPRTARGYWTRTAAGLPGGSGSWLLHAVLSMRRERSTVIPA